MDKIAKDVGDIQSRLLDHRPVLQGEIRYFVREFEEKRAFRECRLLDNLNKMVAEANEQTLPKCTENMQNSLCDILTQLEAANHMTQRIQKRELEAQNIVYMGRRREDWEEFLKQQAQLKEEVDEEHLKAVGRLSTQYSEMKKDLTKYSHF